MGRCLALLTIFSVVNLVKTVGIGFDGQIHDINVIKKCVKGDVLRFRAGAPFKIALFADLHFGEAAWTDWGPQQDLNSVKVMSTVLDAETPVKLSNVRDILPDNKQDILIDGIADDTRFSAEFVIYLGDVITANNIPIANSSSYWDLAISPTRSRGIPWSSVFGNHDDAPFVWPMEWFSAPGIPQVICPGVNYSCYGAEYCSFEGTSRLELIRKEIDHNDLSYTKNGPKDLWPSISNYILNVSSSDDPRSPALFMYFLDSGGGSYPEVISNAQADWFKKKSEEINPDSRVPEIVFWHIPTKSYKKVAPWFGMGKLCIGSINKESVAAQEAELGIMNILVKRPSVKAVFVGHNHGLDWCCPYERLWLCFARHTGYGGYGDWARGARILQIVEKPFSLKSWIRMEDGKVHSEVVLSS